MGAEDKIKNIVAFLCIIFSDSPSALNAIIDIHPLYLMTKWDRFVLGELPEHAFGMHPNLRESYFNAYCERWELSIDKDECEHDFKKTVSQSGMFFINLCHKCMTSKPWTYDDERRLNEPL